jgi:hypothetical protein
MQDIPVSHSLSALLLKIARNLKYMYKEYDIVILTACNLANLYVRQFKFIYI